MLTSACSLLLFIELRERGLLRGYGFDLLKSWEERGEFSIIYQEITRCHHFESMILVSILKHLHMKSALQDGKNGVSYDFLGQS